MTDSKMPERILAADYGQWFIRDTTGTLTAYRREDPAPVADAELKALSHRLQQLLDGDPESKIFDIRRDTITEIVTALRARTAQPVGVWVPDGLLDALRSGRQADADGCMVVVSRQACEEAAAILSALLPEGGATCRKCGGDMKPGIAMGQTFTSGTPDFPGDDEAITLSAGGPGQLIGAMKCSACGWSVTDGGA